MRKIIMALTIAAFCFSATAKTADKKNITPDKPVISTWSKIKEMFQ
jgi:hypothetical protein